MSFGAKSFGPSELNEARVPKIKKNICEEIAHPLKLTDFGSEISTNGSEVE